jgi:hypothetical protein
MTGHQFRPGDEVIWLRHSGGGFVFPVTARVIAVTPKRVTIAADDPEEKDEGIVTRHVQPDRLQPKVVVGTPRRPSRGVSRGSRLAKGAPPAPNTFEAHYPHIASWVQDGWIEIGRDDCSRSFLRAMDIGGMVWEGDEQYSSLDQALRALDEGIAEWLEENG